jgi:ABC-type Fe3+-siderophore transport system permease subunit
LKGTLWHEKDGDFNPGWALFIGFSVLGALGSVAAFVVALRNDKAWPAVVAALCFIAFAMLCTAIIVVPIARAKLMAPALTKAAGSIAKTVAPPYPGMDYDERGDEGND